MTNNNKWRSQVVRKIEILIKDDKEFAKIINYLTQQAQACSGNQNFQVWQMLKDLQISERVFLAYLQQILQEIDKDKESVHDPIEEVFNKMYLKGKIDQSDAIHLDVSKLTVSGSVFFLHAWHCVISSRAQTNVIKVRSHLANNIYLITSAKKAISAANSLRKRPTALAVVYIAYETIKNIYRWWNGEISKKRVVKNIIDLCSSAGAGFGGGVGSAYVGASLGPVGAIVGGVIGSVVMSLGGFVLIDKSTQKIFNIPNDEVLEEAYNFLGVNRKTTNEEINKAYHSLCLKYHSEEGGSILMFLLLQTYMIIIKGARGEQYI